MIFRFIRNPNWMTNYCWATGKIVSNKRKSSKYNLWKSFVKFIFGQSRIYCSRLKLVQLFRFLPQSRSVLALSAAPFLPFGSVHAETIIGDGEQRPSSKTSIPVEEYISIEEMKKCVKSFRDVKTLVDSSGEKEKSQKRDDDWELIMDKNGMKVWRKPVPNSSLCYYRCFAKVTDTASSAYFKVQFEDQMRKQMDKAIKVLTSQPVSLISTDPSATTTSPREQECKVREQNEYGANSDSHVMSKGFDEVLWVHAFPFPLKSRVYRYYRRGAFIPEENAFVLVSKNIDNWDPKNDPQCPKDSVPVETYHSTIVISPLESKTTIDLGFEYVLCYVDDPQIVLPNRFLTIATTDGIPRLMNQYTTAAKVVFASNKETCVDAHEEFSIDPEVRKAFENRKQCEKSSDRGSSFGGNKNRFTSTKQKPKTTEKSKAKIVKENLDTCDKKLTTIAPAADQIISKTSDVVEGKPESEIPKSYHNLKHELTPLILKVNRFISQNECIFNRISDKDNFMFDN